MQLQKPILTVLIGFLIILSISNVSSFEQNFNSSYFNSSRVILTNPNSINTSITSATHIVKSDLSLKFEPGFYKKIRDMRNAGETREYSVIFMVKKADGIGVNAKMVAEINKNNLEDALTHIHSATNVKQTKILSFVTARVPLAEIPKIASYDYVVGIGDGELKGKLLSKSMNDVKSIINEIPNFSFNGTGVTVAVIDTGIRQGSYPNSPHPDLPVGTKIIQQTACSDTGCDLPPPQPLVGYSDNTDHGTHVAGIIAGLGYEDSKMKGIAPGANLFNVLAGVGADSAGIIHALDWSLTHGAKVANVSYGFDCADTMLSLATDEAVEDGLVVVAAAGNDGPHMGTIDNPGCSFNDIAVGALNDNDTLTRNDDTMADFSSKGPTSDNRLKPDLVAPGVRINSTDLCSINGIDYNSLEYWNFVNQQCQNVPILDSKGNNATISGTSFSAPFVSGAAAILLQAHPEYSPLQIKTALLIGANYTWNPNPSLRNPIPMNATYFETHANNAQFNETLDASGFGLIDVNKTLTLAGTGKNIITDTISQGQVHLYNFSANQNDQVKIILSWLKHPLGNVTNPSDEPISNLDFTVIRPDGNVVMSSNSIDQTNEFTIFNAPVTGVYTIKVSAPFIPTPVNSETYVLASTSSINTFLFKEGTFTKQPLGSTQFARPSSDASTGGWTPTPLYAQLNEVTPNDATYVLSPSGTAPQFQVKLSNVSPPITNTGLIIKFRAEAPGGSGTAEKANAVLFQGATQIAQTGLQTLSRTAFTQFQYTLTTTEAASITDYTNLNIQIQTSKANTEVIKVSWIEFDVPPSQTVQSITGLGFQPKALILFTTSQTSQGTTDAYNTAMGFSNGTNSRTISIASDDNISPTNAGRAFGTKIIKILSSGAPTIAAEADLTSFDASGFTLKWTTNDASAPIIHFIALGGNQLTNAAVSSFTASTIAGNQATTGLSFQPDFLMFMHAASTSDTSTSTNGYLSFGFAKPGSRAALAFDSISNLKQGANTNEIQRTDLAIVGLNPATAAINAQADLLSMNTSGFTLNWIQAPTTADKVYYLALKGGSYDIGSFQKTTQSAPVTQTIQGKGFQSKGLILASFNNIANTAVQSNNRISLGATDGISQSTVWAGDQNGAKPTITARSTTTSNVIRMATEASTGSISTINAAANLVSMNYTGFTLNWSTNDAVAKQSVYVQMGDKPSAQIILVEHTVPSDSTVFQFTSSTLSPSSFSLDDNSTTPLPNTQIFSGLLAGTYGVSETANPNFTTSSSCSNGNSINAITVKPGDSVTCTFTNTKLSTLKIVEKTMPQSNTVFQFTSSTLSPSPFTLYDNNTGHDSIKFINLVAGIYNVNEAANTAYKTTSSCSNGNSTNAVSLSAGGNVTCTFTNTDTSTWQYREHKIYSAYDPAWTFTKESSEPKRIIFSSGSSSLGAAYLFKVFNKTDIAGRTIKVTWQGSGESASFEVDDGAYNRTSDTDFPSGSSKVIKGNGTLGYLSESSSWANTDTLTPNWSASTSDQVSIFVSHYDTHIASGGTLYIQKIEIVGYATYVFYDPTITQELTGTVGDYGTYTSSPSIAPSNLIVVKNVINDNGRSLVPANFTMSVSALNANPSTFPGSSGMGTTVSVSPGSYSVNEFTQPMNTLGITPGYKATFSTDCNGNISIGQNKTCTITNNDTSFGPGTWQFREHEPYSGSSTCGQFAPNWSFGGGSGSPIQFSSGTCSIGSGYLFQVFNKSDIAGKTIKITWQGTQQVGGPDSATLEVLDGAYDRANFTDFPANTAIPIKGNGTIGILSHTFSYSNTTETLTPNWSYSTSNQVTLFVVHNDGHVEGASTLYIQKIEIVGYTTYDFTNSTKDQEIGGTTYDQGTYR
jgi:hypothetical protein